MTEIDEIYAKYNLKRPNFDYLFESTGSDIDEHGDISSKSQVVPTRVEVTTNNSVITGKTEGVFGISDSSVRNNTIFPKAKRYDYAESSYMGEGRGSLSNGAMRIAIWTAILALIFIFRRSIIRLVGGVISNVIGVVMGILLILFAVFWIMGIIQARSPFQIAGEFFRNILTRGRRRRR